MRVRRAVLAVFLLVAVWGCARRQPGSVRIDPALAVLVPADTVVVGGVKLEAVRATPVYQKYVAARSLPQLDEFVRRTSLDLRKDVWELLIASNGKSQVVMARGKFSPAGLEPELDKAGLKRFPYKGYTLIGREQAALVFMNSTTAVAGSTAALRSMLDHRETGGGPQALLEKVNSIPAQAQLWLVGAGPFEVPNLPLPHEGSLTVPGQVLRSIQNVTAWADLRAGLDLSVMVACASPQDAQRLHDAIKGLAGMGRLSTPDNQPDLLRFYDSLQVEQQEAQVRLRLRAPLDLIEKVLRWWEVARPGTHS